MFEVVLRFRNDALRPILEAHYGTNRLSGAIKNSVRDLVAGKKMQTHNKARTATMQSDLQDELEAIRAEVLSEFDEDPTP